jgi:hypothetical protein
MSPSIRTDAQATSSGQGRRRVLMATLGVGILSVLVIVASWLSSLSTRPATPIYGSSPAAAVLWSWNGTGYTSGSVPRSGPQSSSIDMAYDRERGAMVIWDHGCRNFVFGFTGGCQSTADATWQLRGDSWTQQHPSSSPRETRQGAMLYDTRRRQVVYVNGAGEAWAWTGADWQAIAMPGSPAVIPPSAPSRAPVSAFAIGYDEGRGLLVYMLSDHTWTWDGTAWRTAGSGIPFSEARSDPHMAYDATHGELVYPGSRMTWTWDGSAWQSHDQPALGSGSLGYDPIRKVAIFVQDTTECDAIACATVTWLRPAGGWIAQSLAGGPRLPIGRSGYFAPPLAFDLARGAIVLLASSR